MIQRKKLCRGAEEFPALRLIDEARRLRFVSAISDGCILSDLEHPPRMVVPSLTAGTCLRFARICYEAAFGEAADKTDVEPYRAFSDGRDGGLINLPQHDAEAFSRGYEMKAFQGAHPFEIPRDEHVLSAHRLPIRARGYFLRLANRRRDRVETHLIGMALALSAAGYPFYMESGRAHAEFARGDDWIAVTNDEIWNFGLPRWPDELGFLKAPQNSVLRFQLILFSDVLHQVEWLKGIPLDYEHLHDSMAKRALTP
jgi:hypothetical protein